MHKDYDQLFYIKTTNRGVSALQSSNYNHYEATPYSILYALFQKYNLKGTDSFVDFGCGKGRLLFYVHHRFGVPVTGVEMNEQLYEKTLKNRTKYLQKAKEKQGSIQVKCCLAENYEVKETENIFYFFNPFSVKIFAKVIGNILESIERQQRVVDIILYYPPAQYIQYLKENTPFGLVQEIKVPGLHRINNEERFLIFRKSI